MELTLREATISDYEEVLHLHKQVHEIHAKARPDHFNKVEISLDRTYYENLLTSEITKVLLLSKGNQTIAFTILKVIQSMAIPILKPRKIVFIDDFGVDAKHRGQGVGKVFMEKILSFAKDMDADALELSAWECNQEAIKFYEAMNLKTKMRRMEIEI